MRPVVWFEKFDGYGMDVSLSMIVEHIPAVANKLEIHLFEQDRIIKLDVPFSEIYHRCTESEWADILDHLTLVFGFDPRIDRRMTFSERRKRWFRKLLGRKR